MHDPVRLVSQRSVPNMASACRFRRNDDLRRPLSEAGLAATCSSDTGYLMPSDSKLSGSLIAPPLK
jgi:hypothetical protein